MALLKFVAEIGNSHFTAAVYKFSSTELFSWSWLFNRVGYVVSFDLVGNKADHFRKVKEAHRSSHRDGMRHTRYVSEEKSSMIGRIAGSPIRDVQTWEALECITVPLDSPFEALSAGPRNGFDETVILTQAMFGGDVRGVDLISYVCQSAHYDQLIEMRAGLLSWKVSESGRNLVVFAEPVRALCS